MNIVCWSSASGRCSGSYATDLSPYEFLIYFKTHHYGDVVINYVIAISEKDFVAWQTSGWHILTRQQLKLQGL